MRFIREYCCCAIPLLNAGIYTSLTEQFVVSVTGGILALVTPPIVGASVPSFVPIVFAALCFVAAGVQLFGFMGVFRESTIIFRRYTTLHLFIVTAIFSFSAVFIGISASKHTTATAKCVTTFFPVDPTVTATALTGSDSEGKLLCNIFTWVGVGTLGGLWLVMAIFHAYLYFVVSGYGSSQRADHTKYYSLYSLNSFPGPTNEVNSSFLPPDHIGMQDMARGGDAWDARDSMDNVGFEKTQPHSQQPYSQQPYSQQPYSQQPYSQQPYSQQPYSQQPYSSGPTPYPAPQRQASDGTMYPTTVRTMSPAPTTVFHNAYEDPYYSNAGMAMGRQEPTMAHPGQ